jgi:hypothetical protein
MYPYISQMALFMWIYWITFCISCLLHACYMPRFSQHLWFVLPNSIGSRAQIMNLLSTYFSLCPATSCVIFYKVLRSQDTLDTKSMWECVVFFLMIWLLIWLLLVTGLTNIFTGTCINTLCTLCSQNGLLTRWYSFVIQEWSVCTDFCTSLYLGILFSEFVVFK